MVDIAWLSQEAKLIHGIFVNLFYGLVTSLLLIGVLVEYFKWPVGGVPSFSHLVGRTLVAAILLHTFPEVSNLVADFSDALAQKVGSLNEFKLVLSKMGEKLDKLTASWVSVKETMTMAISFVTFFALYFSVYIAEGIHLFTWVVGYVFSPLIIAFYVLPSTAGATSSLYRTMFEVSAWKVMWSVLATLLWSGALSEINKPGADVNFISVICLNLALAASVLLTPWVVHALIGQGLAGFTRSVGGVAVGGTSINPVKVFKSSKTFTRSSLARSNKTFVSMKNAYARARGLASPATQKAAPQTKKLSVPTRDHQKMKIPTNHHQIRGNKKT